MEIFHGIKDYQCPKCGNKRFWEPGRGKRNCYTCQSLSGEVDFTCKYGYNGSKSKCKHWRKMEKVEKPLRLSILFGELMVERG